MSNSSKLFQHSLPAARYQAHRAALAAALQAVWDGGQFILGPQTKAFEAEFAAFLGTPYAVGVANGTDALELCLRAFGIGPGDAVLTVSWTATATAAAIERAGAVPVWVDIDPRSFIMDPESLARTIAEHQGGGGRPPLKAVIPVHLYGHPADMPSILSIANQYGLRVIEDCAQSHGAELAGRKTGTWGDAAAFSFYPTKNLGAFGDGGAVVTRDRGLAERIEWLRQYGWQTRFVSAMPGVNSRLDEMQAACLRVVLPHLLTDNVRRRAIAERYHQALAGSAIVPPSAWPDALHAYHQYVVWCARRDALEKALLGCGIPVQVHYPAPVHSQPAYLGRFFMARRGLPHTEAAAREVLSLPISPYLTAAEVERVVASLGRWSEIQDLPK